MSDRIYCDSCDKVIPSDFTRLTLLVGTAKGRTTQSEDTERDYCQNCIAKIPLLKAMYAEQFPERGEG